LAEDYEDFLECYAASSWWAPEARSSTLGKLNTPKGVFCACYEELTDFVDAYFFVGKWVSFGFAVFFGLTFLGCCYLCCCSKPAPARTSQQESAQQPYAQHGSSRRRSTRAPPSSARERSHGCAALRSSPATAQCHTRLAGRAATLTTCTQKTPHTRTESARADPTAAAVTVQFPFPRQPLACP